MAARQRFLWLCAFTYGCGGSLLSACSEADMADYGDTETLLMGQLGELGELEPTASSYYIENSGETLVYMSSAPITCSQIMISRWLGDVEVGAQVVEIVVPSELVAVGKTVDVSEGAEVNFAAGGKSSAYEQSADSGYVEFRQLDPSKNLEGWFKATYATPDVSVEGRFKAEFCPGGQGY